MEPATDTPTKRVDEQLTSILADLSGLDEAALDPTATFTDLGFDSLFLAQFNSQVRRQFGVRVPLEQLLGETSDHRHARGVRRARARARHGPPRPGDGPTDRQVAGTGGTAAPTPHRDADHARPIPLLPNVARYMRERDTPHAEHWNLSVLLDPDGPPRARDDPPRGSRAARAP